MRNHCSKVYLFLLFTLAATCAALGQGQAQSQNPAQEQQKQDTIRISSTYVSVPVIVTDRFGRLVTGLNAQNFSVREDGKPQKVENFSASESPFSVVLLIDTSRSTVRKLGAIQKAAESFIKQLQPRDSVMVLTFDDKINVISDFTGDITALRKAIKAARTGYSTRLYDAIQYAVKEKLAHVDGRKAIVVLTDGVDTASKEATYDSTVSLIAGSGIISYAIQYETRNEGAPIMRPMSLPNDRESFLSPGTGLRFTTGFALSSSFLHFSQPLAAAAFLSAQQSGVIQSHQPAVVKDRYLIASEFLRTLTVVSGARHLRADSIENTSNAFTMIATELRNLYTLGYYSSNELRDGNYRKINVGVGIDGLSARSRDGYQAPKEDAPEDAKEPANKKPPVKP